jgi:excinuclease ABC subunit C
MQEWTIIINDMVKTIKDRYKLKKIPYKIECIDISHLSGWRTSGWLSCFVWGLPYKKWYRKYKISGKIKVWSLKPSDDYAALEEVLERRFKEYLSSSSEIISWNHLPSCLIIDGGKGQLNVVKKLCRDPKRKKIVSQIDIISLGKWEARKKSNIWNFSRRDVDSSRLNKKISEKIYTLDDNLTIHETVIQYDQADKILLKARDEAHRFANSYRKKQMSKEFK